MRRFVPTCDAMVRALLRDADVRSEGQIDGASRRYFGSTSVLVRHAQIETAELAALVSDPHLRARTLRIARGEAAVRAGADLVGVRADLSVHRTNHGLLLLVEIEADLAHRPRSSFA